MSSTANVFAILDLFTTERPIWQTDQIIEALGYSRPTGYRYVKELVDTGVLQKVSASRYALGGRITDRHERQGDGEHVARVHRLCKDASGQAELRQLGRRERARISLANT